MTLSLYTDASTHGHALGMAAVLVADGQEIGWRSSRAWGETYGACTAAELAAIALGVTMIRQTERHLVRLAVYSDSLTAIEALLRLEPEHQHFDLVRRILVLARQYAAVEWWWVRGHGEWQFNHRAHRLACGEMGVIRDLRQSRMERGNFSAGKSALGKVLARWQ